MRKIPAMPLFGSHFVDLPPCLPRRVPMRGWNKSAMNAINRYSLPPPSPRPTTQDILALRQPLTEEAVADFGRHQEAALQDFEQRFATFQ
ncbi:MAG: hypothetical protein AB7O38_31485, partial [Pirellulaceae bacterium]